MTKYIIEYFLIPVFILIAPICVNFVITEFRFLIIMLKIKRNEKIGKKIKKELLEIMKND